MIDLGLGSVELDDEQGFGIERVPGMHEIFRRMDGGPVHHLHAARNDPGGNDLGDAAPGNFRLFDNSASGPTSIKIKELTSHDIKLGVRWDLNSPPAYVPPPLVTKG